MNKLILVGIVVALTACGEKIQDAPQPGDKIMLPTIEWRVVDRATLVDVYRNSGMTVNVVTHGRIQRSDDLTGFVGRRGDQWVIYTLRPEHVDDSATCALGHEVLHIALGDYHR